MTPVRISRNSWKTKIHGLMAKPRPGLCAMGGGIRRLAEKHENQSLAARALPQSARDFRESADVVGGPVGAACGKSR
jgi:hypothetical protein